LIAGFLFYLSTDEFIARIMTAAKLFSSKNLVWMDLEMTGLDPEKEKIIEIATVITDDHLNIIAEGPELVIHQKEKLLKAMDDWNRKQHEKSGLLDRVRESKMTMAEAEERTLDFIKLHCPFKTSPLCGSSVHHDRRFLIKYMPKITDYLHYRHIDVTTVKALVQRWYPRFGRFLKKRDRHRAMPDVKESVEELRFLRKHFFVAEDEDQNVP